jgi:uncharacterized protein (DUF2384 family)
MAVLAPPPNLEDIDVDPAAVLPAVFRVLDAWGLSNRERVAVLGLDSESTLYTWKKKPPTRLSSERLERLGHILWIYELLHAIFGDGPAADGFFHRPNASPPFNGQKPLVLLRSGRFGAIHTIYQWLVAQTQGWL